MPGIAPSNGEVPGATERRMQHEGNGQMDRHPGQIEQCNRPRTDEKAARRFEVSERLHRLLRAAGPTERHLRDSAIDAGADPRIDALADQGQYSLP